MLKATCDLIRAAMAAAALLMATPTMESLLVQASVPPAVATAEAPVTNKTPQGEGVDPSQITMMQWAAKEGGAFVVILVILFFYRRDWKTAVESWREQHAITVALVVENTKAQTDTAAALRENAVVVHQAKNIMARCLPERRDV